MASVIGGPDSGVPSAKEFVPAARFTGAKPGFVFKTGKHGLGYYADGQGSGAEDGGAGGGSGAGANGSGRPAAQEQVHPDELLRQAEEQAGIDQIQQLDAKSLRRLMAGLEKKYKENLELRLKHADQPDKFLDSEVDLDEHIKALMQAASTPELYPLLVEGNGGCVPTLLALLSHENSDVVADVLELLAEFTSAPEDAEDSAEGAGLLVDALVEANGPELLVARLLLLKEEASDEDAKAVHNCMAVFENLIEVQPSLAEALVEKTKLLRWLLGRLKKRDFDSNKLYASEVLAVLVQGNVANQTRLGEANGVDLLLTCVAQYKSRDPAPGEEEEYVQNCFDVLCACLMQPVHKAAFVKAEGVELMHLMLQSRRQCRYGALKCLDYVSTRYGPPCDKLVDLGGLKQLFGLFMGKAKVKGPAGEHDVEREVEERCISLTHNMLAALPPGGSGRAAARRERLLAKFVEAEFEKTDRLMELFFSYLSKVRAQEARLAAEFGVDSLDDVPDGSDEAEEALLSRMDAGLFTLQQVCVIVGNLWASGDAGLRKRLLVLLHQKGHSLTPVMELLLEYHNSIGDEGGPEEAARARANVRSLLSAMGADLEEEEQPGGDDAAEGREAAAAGGEVDADARRAMPPPAPRPPAGAAAAAKGAAGDIEDVEMDVDADADQPGAGPTAGKAAPPAASRPQPQAETSQQRERERGGAGRGQPRRRPRRQRRRQRPQGGTPRKRELRPLQRAGQGAGQGRPRRRGGGRLCKSKRQRQGARRRARSGARPRARPQRPRPRTGQ